MTPKDKAKELIDQFRPFTPSGHSRRHFPKQCALMAVEGLIKEAAELYQETGDIIFKKDIDDSTILDKLEKRVMYWGEVEEEINKL